MNQERDSAASGSPAASPAHALGVFLSFAIVALGLYAPALQGPMITDDLNYIAANPYVHDFGWAHFLDVWNPRGGAAMYIANYSPVTMLLHAAQVSAFGPEMVGYHVSNVLMHALAASLFVAALRRTGVADLPALLGGIFFLVHPANVEAVAWVSQLKTTTALVFCQLAILCWPRRPAMAVSCFAVGLLAMPKAVAVLPALFALTVASGVKPPGLDGAADRHSYRWLTIATAILVVFGVSEFETFRGSNANVAPLHEEPLYQGLNIVVIALRYLVMAVSTLGLSTFHQPEAIRSFLAPSFLLAIPVLGLLGWRTVHTLRERRPEAAWWLFAIAGFAPVSQVFPFLHPIADRYLYFILPGLIGGGLLWATELVGQRPTLRSVRGRNAAIAIAVLVLLGCAARTHDRAGLWRLGPLVLADSAGNYPEGLTALLLEARREASRGEVDRSVATLRRANARGFSGLSQLLADPVYQALRGRTAFESLLQEMARDWIEHFEAVRRPTQLQLKSLARCHLVLGQQGRAVEVLERGIELGGPLTPQLEQQAAALRAGEGA